MVKITVLADSLDGWPNHTNELEVTCIQCVGQEFLQYQTLVAVGENLEELDEFSKPSMTEDEGGEEEDGVEDDSPAIDLFSLSEKQLEGLNYYQVLHLPYKAHLSPDDVKKAYRKASLKYHPDKSGRGEEDAVFLKVKAAFETLSTQKQAYDSTEMPFDDSVPEEGDSVDNFFKVFGPVFERNLHFDARLLPNNGTGNNGSGGGGSNAKKNQSKNRRKARNSSQGVLGETMKPPSLGDESTPIEQVHEFYDYWTHFTSWRDFGLQASRELETQDHLENAESRFEKRWYQKEIDRRAKKLKQQEQARITTLVERAMAADPRLIQERKRLIEEREMKQKQREQEALDKKRKQEEAKLAEERRIQEEKDRKVEEKLQREKEKKMLRKAKQAFRRVVAEALAALLEPEHSLEDPVEEICNKLNRSQLIKFTTKLESLQSNPAQVVQAVKQRVENIDQVDEEDGEDEENAPPNSNGTATMQNGACAVAVVETKETTVEPAPAPSSSSTSTSKSTKLPFTVEELSALAKGVKKFPAGGANRWDQIASYINNVCRPDNPRTKEECIEVFNQNKNSKGPTSTTAGLPSSKQPADVATSATTATTTTTSSSVAQSTEPTDDDVWTEEQDQQLQEGLSKFPATMDKNERWTNIAKGVPGKNKKQCVNRFKAIRDAIKNKK